MYVRMFGTSPLIFPVSMQQRSPSPSLFHILLLEESIRRLLRPHRHIVRRQNRFVNFVFGLLFYYSWYNRCITESKKSSKT